jgi:hypothetical protein
MRTPEDMRKDYPMHAKQMMFQTAVEICAAFVIELKDRGYTLTDPDGAVIEEGLPVTKLLFGIDDEVLAAERVQMVADLRADFEELPTAVQEMMREPLNEVLAEIEKAEAESS